MGINTMANKVEALIGQDSALKSIYDDVTHLIFIFDLIGNIKSIMSIECSWSSSSCFSQQSS